MYQVWNGYYGEFLALGAVGIVLALVRRILFGRLYKDAARGSNGKGKMLRAMTLKFEKSSELKVGIHDMQVFVKKYLCQERRFSLPLLCWRSLPERWSGLILCVGIGEAALLSLLSFDPLFVRNRFFAAATAAAMVWFVLLCLETESLWEQTQVLLQDHVANTLYARQIHVYESFEKPEEEVKQAEASYTLHPEKENGVTKASGRQAGLELKKEEEQLFQEVLADLLG